MFIRFALRPNSREDFNVLDQLLGSRFYLKSGIQFKWFCDPVIVNLGKNSFKGQCDKKLRQYAISQSNPLTIFAT